MTGEQHEISFEATVEKFEGPGGWHAVYLPEDAAAEARFFGRPNALGAISVFARIGKTEVRTSLFPDKRRGSLMLPLKAKLRQRESVHEGDRITVVLVLAG
ncbi:DUF1905 domain-containing protein [Ciceribacter sp. L1K23]|uniref:DUF1905 domain-containing protein n=1 Tax=Ciceribacter sp. L1K23 TaxID=2820276 RepID=UPI0032C23D44